MDKSALRREIRQKKRALTPAQIADASERLGRLFRDSTFYQKAKSIYGYLSYNQEVQTLPILRQALLDGKRVAVPKVYGDRMRFIWLEDFDSIAPGAYGIPEPIEDGPVADDPEALVLAPGLAFDLEGRRCGYGGGFYDKFLRAEAHPTVALCYDFQVFDRLETEPFDVPVDLVLSVPVF